MFGFFKRKDKAATTQSDAQIEEVWGQPVRRKMSKEEAARDAAEQKLIEEKNKERRDMYRLPGRERIFLDTDGRRLALRTEDNTGPKASPHQAPIQVVAFWGVREIGHAKAEIGNGTLRQLEAKVEHGFENRGIAAEILKELETVAREKGVGQICCAGQDNNEWNAAFLAQSGFASQGETLTKSV